MSRCFTGFYEAPAQAELRLNPVQKEEFSKLMSSPMNGSLGTCIRKICSRPSLVYTSQGMNVAPSMTEAERFIGG
jgi:hypothetical protein